MSYLAYHCRVLPLDAAIRLLRNGELPKGPPVVSITFDDGFQNNYDVALPILQQYNLPATIFLSTAFISSDDWYWYCRLHDAVSSTKKDELIWHGERFIFNSIAARAASSSRLRQLLKNQPHQRLLSEMADLVSELGADPRAPVTVNSPYRLLDYNSISKCVDSRLISFGAHTRHHTILSKLDDLDQTNEIVGSIEDVTNLTGRQCNSFAYPNGSQYDYNTATLKLLKQNNVEIAVTTRVFSNLPSSDPLQLGRYGVGCGLPLDSFQKAIKHLKTIDS